MKLQSLNKVKIKKKKRERKKEIEKEPQQSTGYFVCSSSAAEEDFQFVRSPANDKVTHTTAVRAIYRARPALFLVVFSL